jgi:sulfur-oxidizing protein SoxX
MRLIGGVAVAAACILAGAAFAEVAPQDVKIVDGALEMALTDKAGDPVAGRDTFAGRKKGNCLACHMVTSLLDEEQFHGEVGPPLDGVGDVYSAAELRARIVNPKTDLPDTIMPSFYHVGGNRVAEQFAGKTILTAQEVEDVVAYLLTLKE